ncbi:MAG: FHA domain-containing protein [Ilumatobacteraceae bacterium]
MSDQLLGIFKLCLLGLLYLFFARVLWAVWSEVRTQAVPAQPPVDPTLGAPSPKIAPVPGRSTSRPPKTKGGRPTRITIVEPASRANTSYSLDRELSVGRTPNSGIVLQEDTFVSTLHARIFLDGDDVMLEDLGSTNGTYLNGQPINRPNRLSRGDQVQFGNTVLEVA